MGFVQSMEYGNPRHRRLLGEKKILTKIWVFAKIAESQKKPMISTIINNQPVMITFTHSGEDNSCVWFERGVKGYTSCILRDDHGNEIARGAATCAWEDRFNKSIGRRLSLTRAIQGFDRPTRTKIWQTYHNRITG